MRGDRKMVSCPYCKVPAQLMSSVKVYGGRDYGMLYVCQNFPKCDARVGVNKLTGEPLGVMSLKKDRRWKMRAHAVFDVLWKEKRKRTLSTGRTMSKSEARTLAYRWLARNLGLTEAQCHIANFDSELCQKVVKLCEPYVRKIKMKKHDNQGRFF